MCDWWWSCSVLLRSWSQLKAVGGPVRLKMFYVMGSEATTLPQCMKLDIHFTVCPSVLVWMSKHGPHDLVTFHILLIKSRLFILLLSLPRNKCMCLNTSVFAYTLHIYHITGTQICKMSDYLTSRHKNLISQPFNWGLILTFGIVLKLRHTGGTSQSPGNILQCHVVTMPDSWEVGMLCKMKIKTDCNHTQKHYEMFLSMWFTKWWTSP